MTLALAAAMTGVAPLSGLQATPTPERPRATRAVPAYTFLSSMGATSAVSVRGESLERTIEKVRYTGLRFLRVQQGESNLPDLLTLRRETGVRLSYGIGSGVSDIESLLRGARALAAADALVAIEGPNEPNNWPITYQGRQGGGSGSWLPVAELQRDLYRAVNADPVLRRFPVWGTYPGAQTDNTGLQFLTVPEGAGTLMPAGTRFADYAKVHNYFVHPNWPSMRDGQPTWPGIHDNQTWRAADPSSACPVDGLYGHHGLTWLRRFRGYSEAELETLPRVTTETGVTISGPITEELQARFYLALYLAQFKRGFRHTAIYLLRDRVDEAGNQTFGIYRPDNTPRRAAFYLHNLTTILADDRPIRRPGSLAHSIPDRPETVHDLLLQKRDGTFYLVVWSERLNVADEVTVNLGRRFASVTIYDPTVGTSPVATHDGATSVRLSMRHQPLILRLGRRAP
ncbi:MAG TPA: glycosyl hydrolase [Chthonomonadales bacterium]|nr:glycosyl hydrolase [Chthonomonadales bacterium]